MRIRPRSLALLAALVVGLGACGVGGTAERHTPPTQRSSGVPPVGDPVPRAGAGCLRPSDHARVVRFGPSHRLGGYLVGRGRHYVVLAYQSDGDTCQMLPIARLLAGAGYRALAFDFSGRGSSALASSNRLLVDDLSAAVAFARRAGASSVSLLGTSMGAYGALDAGLRVHPPVAAVVSVSAPAAWDDPSGVPLDIRDLTVPTQLWAARYDFSFSDAARRFARLDPEATLSIEPGDAHGVALVPSVFARIRAFLDRHTG